MIKVLDSFSVQESWYDAENGRDQLKQKGFQTNVKLEYLPTHFEKKIAFTLYANNTVPHANNNPHIAYANVTIQFEETRILPPVFNNSYYYIHVTNDGKPIEPKPDYIHAYVPWGFSANNIKYEIHGEPEMIRIDGQGNLSLIKDGILPKGNVKEYSIIAQRTPDAKASVPLIVFLTPTCDCDSDTTPWPLPGICPEHPCPEPCPGTTTLAPTTEPEPVTTTETPPATDEPTSRPPITTPQTTTTEYTEPSTTSDPITTPETATTEPDESSITTPEPITAPETTTVEYTEPPITLDPITTPETTTEEGDETSTTPDPTTMPTPPTLPPGDCQCNCEEFLCSDPQGKPSLNTTEYSIYSDPDNCTIYHRCPTPLVSDDDKLTFECPPETVFCPTMTACTTVEMCVERSRNQSTATKGGYGDYGSWSGSNEDYESDEVDCPECQCRTGILPGEPGYLCNSDNHDKNIPDPLYCDVFHKCQSMRSENQRGYIDYPMRCPPGLIFCPSEDACVRPLENNCSDACTSSMMFRQCDVCIMGRWDDFDIFKQKFVESNGYTDPFSML